MGGLLSIDEHLVVRTYRIGTPCTFAILEIVGRERTAHAELAARYADEDFVLDHHGGRRAGLAFRRIAVLRLPNDHSGLGIERDQRGIGLIQEDLPVGIREAAINRI